MENQTTGDNTLQVIKNSLAILPMGKMKSFEKLSKATDNICNIMISYHQILKNFNGVVVEKGLLRKITIMHRYVYDWTSRKGARLGIGYNGFMK